MVSFKTTHSAKHSKKLAKAGLEFVDEVNQYTDASTFDVIAGVGVGAIAVDINEKTSKETVIIEVYPIGFATNNAEAAINHLEKELETLETYEEIGELTSYLKNERGGFTKERDELIGVHMSYTTEEGGSEEDVSVPVRIDQLENEIEDNKVPSSRRRWLDIIAGLAFILAVLNFILTAIIADSAVYL